MATTMIAPRVHDYDSDNCLNQPIFYSFYAFKVLLRSVRHKAVGNTPAQGRRQRHKAVGTVATLHAIAQGGANQNAQNQDLSLAGLDY